MSPLKRLVRTMATKLNRRDQAIVDWFKKNRPEDAPNVRDVLLGDDPRDRGVQALAACVFEAGRQFQNENPGTTPGDVNCYLHDVPLPEKPRPKKIVTRKDGDYFRAKVGEGEEVKALTESGAIAKLIQTHPELFGIEIDFQ
ncbi:MAG: hypothetical protein HY457_01705 [Parcubacteria group bacterium]|nr:hypothetical protein [Parcubacteria group bacterium]